MKKITTAVVAAGTILTLLAGCAPDGPTPAQLRPTYGVDGQCYEADHEMCDDDPYDLDDLVEQDEHGVVVVPVPGVKKPTTAPAKKPPLIIGTRRR